jgi:hypothetical protein
VNRLQLYGFSIYRVIHMRRSVADVMQDRPLRPPFSVGAPTPPKTSGNAHQDPPTTNGSVSPPIITTTGVSQDLTKNRPMARPADPMGNVCQDSTADSRVLSSAGDIQPQPKTTPIATSCSVLLESLPTISRDKDHYVFLVTEDIEAYLKRDLDHSRLNRIHGYLWMAGRPLNARPIHRQKMMGFDILLTEQADLHLLKFSNKIFVKPLSEYMLNYGFWDKYLCESKELHESACGILLSYVWLICSPLDLKLAHQLDLLSSEITWKWWKTFVADFLSHVDANALNEINKRYHFGELRLGRINSIYGIRFFFTHFIRGYLYGYNRYTIFFQRNFAWMLIVFAYFSLVLSAMQVGAILPPLNTNPAFQQASYGFVVFSIVTVAAIVSFVGILFVVIFLLNMILAISHEKKGRRHREIFAREREKGFQDQQG